MGQSYIDFSPDQSAALSLYFSTKDSLFGRERLLTTLVEHDIATAFSLTTWDGVRVGRVDSVRFLVNSAFLIHVESVDSGPWHAIKARRFGIEDPPVYFHAYPGLEEATILYGCVAEFVRDGFAREEVLYKVVCLDHFLPEYVPLWHETIDRMTARANSDGNIL